MLVVSHRRRAALFVPVSFVLLAALFTVPAAQALLTRPSLGRAVATLLGLGICAVVLSEIGFTRREGERIVVRTPYGRTSVRARSSAIGVSVSHGARGGTTFTVIATDGTSRAELASYWYAAGAERARTRLESALMEPGELADPSAARARAQVDGERLRWESSSAAAKAQVDAYYRSPAWKKTTFYIVGGVALYAIAMQLYFWLSGSPGAPPPGISTTLQR